MSFSTEESQVVHDTSYDRAGTLKTKPKINIGSCTDPKCPDHGPHAVGEKTYQVSTRTSFGPFQV